MKFDTETYLPGQFPEFGAIFMSNSATKEECFKRKLLGLPSRQAHFVKQVKAGMILFLFEFERRELHGVFQACSDGAIDIMPYAFKSSGKQFPAQVKFIPIWHCSPLPESVFRDAIRENYFTANKFNFGLSEKQVQKLLSLFRLRKSKDKNIVSHSTKSNVGKKVGCTVNITANAVDDGSFLTLDNEKVEGNDKMHFGSISSKCSQDCINDYIRAIDADMTAGASVGHGHKPKHDFGICCSNKHFGSPLSRIGGSVDNVQMLTSNEIENKNDVDIDPRYVSISPAHSFTSVRSIPNHVSNVTISGEEFEWNMFQSCDSAKHPDFFESHLPVYSSKSISEKNSLINDQLQQYSAMQSVASQNLNSFHSVSHHDVIAVNNLPYSPDFPDLNMHSLPPELLKSVPGYSNHSSIFPHLENQSLSSYMEPKSTSKLNSDVSDNVPLYCSNLDISSYSKNMYSVCKKKRESVFSRLALPLDLGEEGVGQVECGGMDSSMDEVMAMLHQSHFNWVKAKSAEKLIRRQDNIVDLRKKRQETMNSRLFKDKKEIGRNYVSSGEEKTIQKAEYIPSVDFKRRSELQKSRGDANSRTCNESVDNSGFLDGQRKRRKLIRPNFSITEPSGDVMVGGTDKRSNKTEIFQVPPVSIQKEHISCEGKNIDVEKNSDYEEVGVESSVLSFKNADGGRKSELQTAGVRKVPSLTLWKSESCEIEEGSTFKNCEDDGLSQNASDTRWSICQESFLGSHREKLKAVANGGTDDNEGGSKSLQDVMNKSYPE